MSKIINHMRKVWLLPFLLLVLGLVLSLPLAIKNWAQAGLTGGLGAGSGDQNCGNQNTGSPSEPCDQGGSSGGPPGEEPPDKKSGPPGGEGGGTNPCPTCEDKNKTCPIPGPSPSPTNDPDEGGSSDGGSPGLAEQEQGKGAEGCQASNHFDAYTGNVSRTIVDLTLYGSTGNFPISFIRYSNSRMAPQSTSSGRFGRDTVWTHSYQWFLRSGGTSSTSGQPVLRLAYPNGADVTFEQSAVDPTIWAGPENRRAYIQQDGDNFTFITKDGNKQKFVKRTNSTSGAVFYRFEGAEDSIGNQYTVSYNTANDTLPRQITDPSGRWLKITYSNLAALGQTQRVLGTVDYDSTQGVWQEITLNTSTQTASRHLALFMNNDYRNAEALPVSEVEFYDENDTLITGTQFGSDPYFQDDPQNPNNDHEIAKAFDGDTATYYRYAYKRNGYIGLDAGAPKLVSKVRVFIPSGVVTNAAQFQIVGLTGASVNTWTVKEVEADDGRKVIYNYSVFTDPSGIFSWQTLTSVTYPEGANALYSYAQVADYTRPVLVESMDVHESGNAPHIAYQFDPGTSVGYLRRELSGATGEVIAETRTISAHKAAVDYPNGRTVTLEHAASNANITKTTDGLGNASTFTYDQTGGGFLASRTDPLGRTTSLSHDALGNLTAATQPDGTAHQWNRDAEGKVSSYTVTPVGGTARTTSYTRDAQDRITRADYPDGSYETWTYTSHGLALTHLLPNGTTESWTYGANSQVATHTDVMGAVTTYGYNALGLLTSVTDPLGRTTSYTLDAAGRVIQTTFADGSFISRTLDDYGNMLSVTDEAGHTTTHSYDEFKRRVSTTDALGRTTLVDYGGGTASGGCGACNSRAKPVLTTYPNGLKVKNTYDVEWRLLSRTVAYGTGEAATTSYVYDKVGNVTKVTDPLLRNTFNVFDNRNRLIKTTYPGGAFVTMAYDDRGNMISSTDELGKTSTSTYGLMNELLTTTDATGRTTTYTYAAAGSAAAGKPTRVTANSGRISDTIYDALWRVTSATIATGTAEQATNSRVFDAVGNVTSSTDEMGRTTTFVYDNRNRLVSTTDAIGRVSGTTYSADGLPLVRTFPDGTTEASTYDAAHRLVSVTDALNRTTTYGYSTMDKLTSLTDARGSVTQWTYDLSGRMKSKVYADGSQELYAYDLASQLTGVTRPGGQVETRVYSNRGWMTASNFVSGVAPSRTYTYDLAGRQLTASISGTGLITRTFDEAGRQLTEAQRINAAGNATFTVSYAYDADGRRASMTYPDGKVLSYAYNNRGELSALNDAGSTTPVLSYTRRLDGSIGGTTHRNGVTTAKAYDGIGRLTGTGHSAPGGLLLGGESYTLDVMSRRTSRTFANGTGDVFGYDAVGQVTAALYASTTAAAQATAGGWTPAATWAYDDAGNRTTQNDNGNVTTYTANNLNQYTAINAAAPTYNANGDLLTDQTRSYTWNGRSQMTAVVTGSVTETHNYDALGRRIARTDASGTIYFIHDGWNVIAEYKRQSATNILQRRYVWGQDLSGSRQGAGGVGGLVVTEEVSGTTTTPYCFHYDGNGNVVEITDASGTVVASYRYDAYGRTLTVSGSYAATNRYRFSTKQVELASGLYYYGYRFYDPANGRWTARDPIGETDGVNVYALLLNGPIHYVDYLGLDGCSCPGCNCANNTHPSDDAAAQEAGEEARKMAKQWDKDHNNKSAVRMEFCGRICKNKKTGQFQRTGPVKGFEPQNVDATKYGGGCQPFDAPDCSSLGKCWEFAGTYHSHPTSQSFSDEDKTFANHPGHKKKPHYVTRGPQEGEKGDQTEKFTPHSGDYNPVPNKDGNGRDVGGSTTNVTAR